MTTVWGDGFVDDGWSDVLSVRSWETCSTDELVRFFPKLAVDDASASRQALMRLEDQMVRRAAPSDRPRSDGSASDDAGRSSTMPRERDRHPSTIRRLAWRPARHGDASGVARRGLVFLHDVVGAIQSGSLVDPDETLVTTFAFHAGIHPAYFWPRAVLSHERETAACWLGHVARGRAALLPTDLADYLLDVVERRCGSAVFRDQHLGRATAGSVDVGAVALAASRRAAGRRVIVRQRRAPQMDAGVFDSAISEPGFHDAGKPGHRAATTLPSPQAALRRNSVTVPW